MKITWHRNPRERSFWERVARRFIIPDYGDRSYSMSAFLASMDRLGYRKRRLSRNFPVRWFLSETLPDFFMAIERRHRDVRNWIRFRTWDRYDLVRIEMTPDYIDPDERLLRSSFQILKDFVEIELAAMNLACGHSIEDGEPIGDFLGRFGAKFRSMKRSDRRSPGEGLAYLDWEINETDSLGSLPTQADLAREKKELYLWWTVWRPTRLDPYGGDPLIRGLPEGQITKVMVNLESFYQNEDDEMLARLMAVRRSLWT